MLSDPTGVGGSVFQCLPRDLAGLLARSRSDPRRRRREPPGLGKPRARLPAARPRTWTPTCCELAAPRHVPFRGRVEHWWAWSISFGVVQSVLQLAPDARAARRLLPFLPLSARGGWYP